jgi:hypothetical protein
VVAPEGIAARRSRSLGIIKKELEEIVESLGTRDLDKILTFAEFVRTRRAQKTLARSEAASRPAEPAPAPTPPEDSSVDFEPPSSQQRTASRGG